MRVTSSWRRCSTGPCSNAAPFPRGRGFAIAAFVLVMVLGWDAIGRAVPALAPVLLTALPIGTALFTGWLIGYGQSDVGPRRKDGKEEAKERRVAADHGVICLAV